MNVTTGSQVLIVKTIEKKTEKALEKSLRLPPHHKPRGLGGQNRFWGHVWGANFLCLPGILLCVPCVPAAPAPDVAQRAPGMAQAATLGCVSRKPWRHTPGAMSVDVQNARVVKAWRLPHRFQKMDRNVWVPQQKPAAEAEPSQRVCARTMSRVAAGTELSPSRPQNSRATGTMYPQAGKVTGILLQPMTAASRGDCTQQSHGAGTAGLP